MLWYYGIIFCLNGVVREHPSSKHNAINLSLGSEKKKKRKGNPKQTKYT